MSHGSVRYLDPPRALSAWERAVLERLIGFAPSDLQESLLGQSPQLQVVRQCDCGCASVEFERESHGDRLVIDGVGDDSDGMEIMFLLHVLGGRISSLESVRGDGEPSLRSPEASQIDRVEWDQTGPNEAVARRVQDP